MPILSSSSGFAITPSRTTVGRLSGGWRSKSTPCTSPTASPIPSILATLINSTLGPEEQRERIKALARGEFKLVYIAPERFRSRSFLEALGQSTIALFAVDEAHCLSMWGHDFRPDYFRLDQVLETLGRPQVAAFTATATPEVRRDILTHLRLREPREFVAGFARPNLKLLITHVVNEPQKYERLNALIRENKTGIVYCSTRKRGSPGRCCACGSGRGRRWCSGPAAGWRWM